MGSVGRCSLLPVYIMIDLYEIIKTIEKIYKEKKQNAKHKFKLLILPRIVLLILFCFLYFLSFCNKYSPFYLFPSLACFIISLFMVLYYHKKFLIIQYGIEDNNNDEKFYYDLFKKNILENKFSKEILTKVKDILEIETREEQNPLTTYFMGCCSLILIPISFIIFEDYIKENIIFFCIIFSIAIFFPIFIYLIDLSINIKHNNKKTILKMIERILIEIED